MSGPNGPPAGRTSDPEPERGRIVWAAWRVAEDGSIQVSATLDREEGEGYHRERWDFPSLAAAADALGPGFRDVVERVLEEGRRQGRWRP